MCDLALEWWISAISYGAVCLILIGLSFWALGAFDA